MDAAKDTNYMIVDLDNCINREIYNYYEKGIKGNKKVYENLISIAIEKLAGAKKNHDLMEAQYTPNMNYDETEKVRNRIIEIISRYGN